MRERARSRATLTTKTGEKEGAGAGGGEAEDRAEDDCVKQTERHVQQLLVLAKEHDDEHDDRGRINVAEIN